MENNRELASNIISLLGGKENIINSYHCMTRLRFNLKDEKAADLNKLKLMQGVLGAQISSGEIQVIIGPAVEAVYKEVIALAGLKEQEAINERLDDLPDCKGEKII